MTQEQREYSAHLLGKKLELIERVQMSGVQLSDNETNAAEAYRTAISVLREPGWVRTSDDVPHIIGDVLIVWNGRTTLGLFEGDWYYLDPDRLEYRKDIWSKVTHWRYLPALPPIPEADE